MGSLSFIKNVSDSIKSVALCAQQGVAGGTGDNTELTSPVINRKPAGLVGYESGLMVLTVLTTLTAVETLKATIKIAESADGTNFDTAETLISAATLKTGALTGDLSTYELAFDFSARKQYVRFLITLDCSKATVDIFVYGATMILGGSDRLPV